MYSGVVYASLKVAIKLRATVEMHGEPDTHGSLFSPYGGSPDEPSYLSPKPLIQLGSAPLLAKPAARRLQPTSPAMTVLTDFSQVMPQSVDADTPIDEAHLKMRYSGVRLLFVMDHHAHCIGIITSKEVIGTRRINIAMQQRNLTRNEVTAEMIMTPWHA